MYKYYNEILSLSNIKALSNIFNCDCENINDITDESILCNINNEEVDIDFLREFIKTKKFRSMMKHYLNIKSKINYYSKYSIEELVEKFIKINRK